MCWFFFFYNELHKFEIHVARKVEGRPLRPIKSVSSQNARGNLSLVLSGWSCSWQRTRNFSFLSPWGFLRSVGSNFTHYTSTSWTTLQSCIEEEGSPPITRKYIVKLYRERYCTKYFYSLNPKVTPMQNRHSTFLRRYGLCLMPYAYKMGNKDGNARLLIIFQNNGSWSIL